MVEMSKEFEDNILTLFSSGLRTFLVRGQVDKKKSLISESSMALPLIKYAAPP